MAKNLILTLDAGTTGSKCSVFDLKGAALCVAKKEYPTNYPKPNWAEQDPDVLLQAILDGVRELLTQVSPADIACVGLSGTMNGCIAVAEDGRVLYPNILHSDSRAWREALAIEKTISRDDFYRMTGNRLDHHFTLPKILWTRKHLPDVYRRTRWWLNTKDYLYARLTGRIGFTDYSDASLTIALDLNKKQWASELLTDLGLDPARMPQVLKGSDVSGRITREISKLTGLLPGTPVAMGGGDGACAGRGAGLYKPGAGYCCIGSSAWVSQLTPEPILDEKQRIFNYLDMDGEINHSLGVVQTAGSAYDWAVDNLLSDGRKQTSADHSRIENMARQIEPGAEGVMFLNTLMGERTPYWDPNTKGCLIGFSLYHDQRHVARAIFEGVALSLSTVARIMTENGAPISSIMLTGGGANSGIWPDIFASVFGVPTSVHYAPGEGTSLGAAMTAGVGIGLFKDYEQAAGIVRARSQHQVNPAWADKYKKVYEIYSGIYERMKPVFDGIAREWP